MPVSEKHWICKRNRWWKFKSQLARIQTQGLLQSVPAPNHWATKTWYCWFLIKCTKLISRQTPLIDSKILHFFSLKLYTNVINTKVQRFMFSWFSRKWQDWGIKYPYTVRKRPGDILLHLVKFSNFYVEKCKLRKCYKACVAFPWK